MYSIFKSKKSTRGMDKFDRVHAPALGEQRLARTFHLGEDNCSKAIEKFNEFEEETSDPPPSNIIKKLKEVKSVVGNDSALSDAADYAAGLLDQLSTKTDEESSRIRKEVSDRLAELFPLLRDQLLKIEIKIESEITRLSKKNDELHAKVVVSDSGDDRRVAVSEGAQRMLEKQVQDLKKETKESRAKCDDLESRRSYWKNKSESFRTEKQTLEQDIDQLKKRFEALEDQHSLSKERAVSDKSTLERDRDHLRIRLETFEAQRTLSREQAATEKRSLERDNDQLKKQVQHLQAQCSSSEEQAMVEKNALIRDRDQLQKEIETLQDQHSISIEKAMAENNTLTEDNDQLKKQVELLQVRCSSSEEQAMVEKNALTGDRDQLKNRLESLEKQHTLSIEQTMAEKKTLIRDKDRSVKQIESLNIKLGETTQAKDNALTTSAKLEDEKKDLVNEVGKLIDSRTSEKERADKLYMDLDNANMSRQALSLKVDELERSRDLLRSTQNAEIERLTKLCNTFYQEKKDQEAVIEKLQEDAHHAVSREKVLQETVNELREKNEKLTEELVSKNNDLGVKNSRNQRLRKDADEMKEKIKTLQFQHLGASNAVIKIIEDKAMIDRNLEGALFEIEGLVAAGTSLEKEKETWQRLQLKLENTVGALNQKIEELEYDAIGLREAENDLQRDLGDLQDCYADLKEEYDSTNISNSRLKMDLEGLRHKVQVLETEKKSIEQVVRTLEQIKHALEGEEQSAMDEIDVLRNENEQLRSDLVDKSLDEVKLRSAILGSDLAIKEMKNDISDLKSSESSWKSRAVARQSTVDALLDDYNQLKEKLVDYQAIQRMLRDGDVAYHKLQEDQHQLEQDLNSQYNGLSLSYKTLSNEKDLLESKFNECVVVRNDLIADKQDLTAEVQRLRTLCAGKVDRTVFDDLKSRYDNLKTIDDENYAVSEKARWELSWQLTNLKEICDSKVPREAFDNMEAACAKIQADYDELKASSDAKVDQTIFRNSQHAHAQLQEEFRILKTLSEKKIDRDEFDDLQRLCDSRVELADFQNLQKEHSLCVSKIDGDIHNQLQLQMKDLQQKYKDCVEKFQRLYGDHILCDKNAARLQSELDSIRDEYSDCTEKLEQIQTEHALCADEVDLEPCTRLQGELDSIRDKYSDCIEKLERLQNEHILCTDKVDLESHTRLQGELDFIRDKYSDCTEKLERLQNEHILCTDKVDPESHTRLQSELDSLRSDYSSCIEKFEQIQTEHALCADKVDRESHTRLQGELNSLQGKYISSIEKLDRLHTEHSLCSGKVDLESYTRLQAELDSLRTEHSVCVEKVSRAEFEQIRAEHAQCAQKLADATRQTPRTFAIPATPSRARQNSGTEIDNMLSTPSQHRSSIPSQAVYGSRSGSQPEFRPAFEDGSQFEFQSRRSSNASSDGSGYRSPYGSIRQTLSPSPSTMARVGGHGSSNQSPLLPITSMVDLRLSNQASGSHSSGNPHQESGSSYTFQPPITSTQPRAENRGYTFIVNGDLATGPRTLDVSQSLIEKMDQQIRDWTSNNIHTWAATSTKSHTRCITSRTAHLSMHLSPPAPTNPVSACRYCIDRKRLCVLVDRHGPAIVPLPLSERSIGATPTSGDYFAKS